MSEFVWFLLGCVWGMVGVLTQVAIKFKTGEWKKATR